MKKDKKGPSKKTWVTKEDELALNYSRGSKPSDSSLMRPKNVFRSKKDFE